MGETPIVDPDRRKATLKSLAGIEVTRIRGLKDRLGEGTYAECVGQAIVTWELYLADPNLHSMAEEVIRGLQGDIKTISTRPDLATCFVMGVYKELEARNFFGPKPQEDK